MATKSKNPIHQFLRDQRMGARRSVVEEMFNDMYKDRRNIYLMNFFRGIFFGLGSALGGTLVLAIVVWIMSFFVSIPGIGQNIEKAQHTIQQSEHK